MNKKLLAVALGAALAPAMAQADVTVYGIAQVEWANVKNDGSWGFGTMSTGNFGSYWNNPVVASNTSSHGTLDNALGRFGIKASEDLGNGMTGLAQFEFQTDTADNNFAGGTSGTLGQRSSFVGLGIKNIGTIRLGRDSTPYALSGTALDPFVGTTLEARNNMGMSGNKDGWGVMNAHNSFVNDSLFFNSASWGGVYVNLSLGLEHGGTTPTCGTFNLWNNCDGGTDGAKNGGNLSTVVGWKNDSMNFFGSYMKMTSTANVDDPTAMKLGAQMTFAKAHTVSLQYEQTDRATGNDWDKATYIFVGYQGTFGPVRGVAQLGQMQTGTTAGIDISGSYYALGAFYDMSKTFHVFGGYRKSKEDLNPATGITLLDNSVYTLGMRKDF